MLKKKEVSIVRGRGLAFLAGRAAGKNRAYEDQMTQSQQTTAEPQESKTEKLEELGKLHDSGVLTDDEFTQEKKKVLSGK